VVGSGTTPKPRRAHDVERAVGEAQVGGIHLEQAHGADVLAGHALARLLQHVSGQVDSGDDAVPRI
jgi:hypothetical protein